MADIRKAMHDVMVATLADEAAHHDWMYHAVRPMPVPPTWKPGQRVVGDCSKGCQYIARWSGAAAFLDPMGNNWSAFGNSQTICMHLHHVDTPGELEVGDMVTFGHDGDEHAGCVIEAGHDPLLWSFGHQTAPNTYRLSYDRREHQLLKMPIAAVPPTPESKLRSLTGWFSWTKWRLGEGEWAKYGKVNPLVRPNVPKVIPADWWRRYVKFIANRNKGNR